MSIVEQQSRRPATSAQTVGPGRPLHAPLATIARAARGVGPPLTVIRAVMRGALLLVALAGPAGTITRGALLSVALAGPVAAIAAPAPASAAQYTVDACQHPDGTPAPIDGWVGSARGAFVYASHSCGAGGSLTNNWSEAIEHSYQDGSSWAFTAPSNTSLAHITARRETEPGASRAYGSPVTYVSSDQGSIEQCTQYSGCQGLFGDISYALNRASFVAAGIVCGGGPGGSCPVGGTSSMIRRIAVTLNDDQAPAFNGPPSGSLLSERTTTRQRTVNYSATDQGGGVYRQRLLVDGTEVASGVVDDNDGKCARYPAGGGFSYRAPCRNTASGSITLDTAGLKDGEHELTLEVRDATDTNKVAYGPWPITVNNGTQVSPTGDFDGDGIPNATDPDDDNDGTPDTRDPAPYDGSIPARVEKGPGASTDQTTPGSSSGSRGGPNGTRAAPDAKLTVAFARGRTKGVSRFGRSATIRGRLTTKEGTPISTAKVDLRYLSGAGKWSDMGGATTEEDGGFRLRLPSNIGSRVMMVSYRYDPSVTDADVTTSLTLRVLASMSLHVRRSRGMLVFSGRAGLPGNSKAGRQVTIEYRVGKRPWNPFAHARTTRTGGFVARFRPAARLIGQVQFRAVVGSGANVVGSASKVRAVRFSR